MGCESYGILCVASNCICNDRDFIFNSWKFYCINIPLCRTLLQIGAAHVGHANALQPFTS